MRRVLRAMERPRRRLNCPLSYLIMSSNTLISYDISPRNKIPQKFLKYQLATERKSFICGTARRARSFYDFATSPLQVMLFLFQVAAFRHTCATCTHTSTDTTRYQMLVVARLERSLKAWRTDCFFSSEYLLGDLFSLVHLRI